MHRHRDDPKELDVLLTDFFGGEFILKKGRGKDTLVYSGRIDKIVIPNLSQKMMVIQSRILYERWIGCDADFAEAERWKAIDPPSEGIAFGYSWFYQQKRYARLKLESTASNERCWLCSYTDPIHLELFRAMLMKMFLEESLRKESSWKKLRNRLLT